MTEINKDAHRATEYFPDSEDQLKAHYGTLREYYIINFFPVNDQQRYD